jgi:hypothetical protein
MHEINKILISDRLLGKKKYIQGIINNKYLCAGNIKEITNINYTQTNQELALQVMLRTYLKLSTQ